MFEIFVLIVKWFVGRQAAMYRHVRLVATMRWTMSSGIRGMAMAEINHKTLSPEDVRRAIDTAATEVVDAGTSGCPMLKVIEEMSRQDVIAVLRAAQAKDILRNQENGYASNLEFHAYDYQPDSTVKQGGQTVPAPVETGASVDLNGGPGVDGKVNLMIYDTGRKTGGCSNVRVDGDEITVTK